MSIATPTSPLRRPPVDDRPTSYPTPVIFLSAVVRYREVFWSLADHPARQA